MDKIRAMLPVLKKHHFWVLTTVVVLAAVFGWWKGSGGLDEEYQSKRKSLEDVFTSVNAVARQINHPNDSFIVGVNGQHDDLKEQVFVAWRLLYADQQEILLWPENFEDVGELDPDEEISRPLRERFRNYYSDVFPTLFERVDPVRSAELPEGAAEDAEPEKIGMVFWDQDQRNAIREQYVWETTTPSTKAIRFAQEDLWVYEALLTIIKRTNEVSGATANYNAAVKQINDLRIGKLADRPKTSLKFAVGSESSPSPAAPTSSSGMGGGGGGASSVEADAALENGRYVDDKGNPLGTAASGPFTEFKLMPVLIDVEIDQRRIPLLLAECANSALPVEVRMVRINPDAKGAGGGGGARGGGGLGQNLGLGALLPKPAVEPKYRFVAFYQGQGRTQRRGGQSSQPAGSGGMGRNLGNAPPARAQSRQRSSSNRRGLGQNLSGGRGMGQNLGRTAPTQSQSRGRPSSGSGGLGRNLSGGAAPARTPSSSGGRSGGGGMGQNVGGMGKNAGAGMGRNVGGADGEGAAVKSDFDVTLQLWGLIYIFERPDATKLKIDEELAKQIAEAAAETDADIGSADDTSSQAIARGEFPSDVGATPPNPATN